MAIFIDSVSSFAHNRSSFVNELPFIILACNNWFPIYIEIKVTSYKMWVEVE